MHLGFGNEEFVRNSDVIFVIEADVPWTPVTTEPKEDAVIIVLDEEALYSGYPHRGFPNDITLSGSAKETLMVMNTILKDSVFEQKKIELRSKECANRHDQQRKTWKDEALAFAHNLPLEPKWISKCIGDQFNPETDIVVTEFVLDPTQICVTRPGSYYDHSHAGGLGWSSGAALGAKLAASDKTVICCVGDGTYTFGVPVASHQMSAMHDLPILFIVYNNAAWDRTPRGSRLVSRDGYVNNLKSV